ncbi:hypothetical protein KDD17_11610 [Sulfitobacter albidus]|uniref:Uncharacterized protein n=1 Tax=Sulfitobacter albidus TaxID=2829501 RepID=A0A975JCK5_9RHOB|nr:hypothetical protein [Sulfitobacter albidus]QUJ75600.1 hypothetical protein KDD17_11610 [Sulfitobacter albidus]
MTEIPKITERRTLHWRAFIASLLLPPVVTLGPLLLVSLAIPTLNTLLIVVYVMLVFGGAIYLLIGTPTLIWYLRRQPADPFKTALIALVSLLILIPAAPLFWLFTGDRDAMWISATLMMFGAVLAPLWAAIFALLYNRFTHGKEKKC